MSDASREAHRGDAAGERRCVHPLVALVLGVATVYVLLLAAVLLWYAQPFNDDFARAAVPLGGLPEYVGIQYADTEPGQLPPDSHS